MSAWRQTTPDHGPARLAGGATFARPTEARPPRAVLAARLALHLTLGPRTTLALLDWCRLHDIGAGEVVVEPRAMPIAPRVDDDLLERLATAPGEAPSHRRMRLRRGDIALASCDLWWLPTRMAPAMQAAFRADVLPDPAMLQPLVLRRHMLVEARPAEGPCLLERRGIIIAADGAPVAAFHEAYRPEIRALRG